MIEGIITGLAQFGIALMIMLIIALLMDLPEQRRKTKALNAEKEKQQQDDFERQLTADIMAQFDIASNRLRERRRLIEAIDHLPDGSVKIVSIPGVLAEFRRNHSERTYNHEIWWKCESCGGEYDARLSSICDHCKHDNEYGA
ncbi:MAG: hypothetical protein EOO42_04315 [Flavobacteriales bacterium]|nr:MAG: hypothetical protein EOO42_04315 [Flavobacteriales bacterium]